MRMIDGDALKRKAQREATDAWKMKVTAKVETLLNQFIDWIENAPTIEPERKKGKWIEDAETYYKAVNEKGGGVDEDTPYFVDDIACSECLALFSVIDNETERFDYCPNCGADMRGGQE